ncbi:MAG: DUF2075 domain-containing protein [Anaerolineae bacterium]|nr:DUF2075 domain-containing protein [Anaerolineae bacterium]
MSYSLNDFPQRSSNDPKQLINKALAEGYLLYITYRDRDRNETKRTIEPLEWVEDYKIRAFCHLAKDERHFVVSGIREISLVAKSSDDVLPVVNPPRGNTSKISSLDQWRSSEPILSADSNALPPKKSPQFKPDQIFSQVQNSEQWRQLISYYAECLNREYLQDYLIEQRGDYRFFPVDEDVILRFLAGGSSFSFPTISGNQPVEIAEFITSPTKRDQQLCIGYPSLLTPEGKIAPLFFTPCEVVQQDGKIILHPDEYQLNYAILYSLDLDKEEFAAVVTDLNQHEFEDLAVKLKALQESLVLKLENLTSNVIPRREANRPRLLDAVDQMMLFTTPCLFWASKNNITSALIEELQEISKVSWNTVPKPLLQLLNISTPGEYPNSVPLGRDNKVFMTPINDDQRQASHAALSMPITVVTGPPGTGKSQLVVNIIANAVLDGKSVLFASRNNQAVDVVVKRIQTDMHFDGLIRTGSRNIRKDAAGVMLRALSKAAAPHAPKDLNLLVERYKQAKTALANQIDTLNEIQRLKANQLSKRQQLEEMLVDLPQELANRIKQETISSSQGSIDTARQFTKSLIRNYETMQHHKTTIEAVLQENITDNRHKHPLVTDIENFEMEWGSFGHGVRDANYFTSLETLQRYVELWTQLLDAVEARMAMEKASNEVIKLEKKLAELMQSLPNGLQVEAQNAAKSMPKDRLNDLRNQIALIDKQLTETQKSSFSNWFGLRRGPQIRTIMVNFNPLLSDLEQPLLKETPNLGELRQKYGITKNYILAVLGIRSLASKQHDLKRIEKKVLETTSVFDDKTRSDFARLKTQPVDPTILRTVLLKITQQISEIFTQRTETITAFITHMDKNSSLGGLWSQYQNEVGKDEYAGWTLDGEISISVLQHFASQWLSVLNAVEMKADLEQLEAIIQSKGGEEGAIVRVVTSQQNATSQAIEILNSTWLQNIDNLQSTRIQRVRDYASLVQEVSENYDKQKYGNMMSIQETYSGDIIAAFPVWATTNLSISRNLPLKAEMFDLLIMDEASQCDIPSALPLIYRAKQVVIIGDAMQLRHIATLTEDSHQILAAEYNIATEAYSYTQHSLFDLAARSVGQHPGVLMLREHYRSHENIISFSNQTFYDGQLVIKTDMSNRKIPAAMIERGCGIFWLNVAGETIQPSGGSAKNLQESNAIQQALPAIYQQLEQIGWDGSVGIVTPYREQRNTIQGWVDDSQFGQQVTVGTAHTFQGDERDILLFSTVLAPGISEGSLAWLRRTSNLLNVAVTRARTILIIVGDFNFCMSLPDNNPYKQLAEYIRSKPQSVLQSWKELPVLSAKD